MIHRLSTGEQDITEAGQLRPMPIERAWDYWVRHIEKAGLMPEKPAKGKAAAAKTRTQTKTAKKRKTVKKSGNKKRR